MSRYMEDEQWLLHQSQPRSLESRKDPCVKTCITYFGAACVSFTLVLVGVFVFMIAYDVRKADSTAAAIFPVKVRTQKHRPAPILCHINVARFYDSELLYKTTELPGNYCSHLVFPLRGFLSGGNETPDSPLTFGLVQSRLIELRDKVNNSFPHLKYLVAAGDENGGGRLAFHDTPNATAYMTFLVEMVRWLIQTRFDGLVLNSVFPMENEHRRHMAVFLSHLKQAMHKHGLLFVVTARWDTGIFKSGARPGRLSKFLDYVGVVTHSLHRAANATDRILVPFHHQRGQKNSRSVEDSIDHVISSGVPRSKVLITVSLAGYVCTVTQLPEKDEVPTWSSARALRVVSYGEACHLVRQPDWALSYDHESEKPHAWRNNLWMGYEDEISVRKTASLVDKMYLGGVLIWDVGNDDHTGRCGLTNPLVRAIFTEVEGTPIDDNPGAIIPSFNITDADAHTGNKTKLSG
ncbi:chitinase-3-like protein 2 [Amblyomma americanum]